MVLCSALWIPTSPLYRNSPPDQAALSTQLHIDDLPIDLVCLMKSQDAWKCAWVVSCQSRDEWGLFLCPGRGRGACGLEAVDEESRLIAVPQCCHVKAQWLQPQRYPMTSPLISLPPSLSLSLHPSPPPMPPTHSPLCPLRVGVKIIYNPAFVVGLCSLYHSHNQGQVTW